MIISRRAFLGVGSAGTLAYLAQPTSAPVEITTGQHPLKLSNGPDGLLYVPRGYKAGVAAPLIVMLHGFSGTAQSVDHTFPLADEFGVVILAPDSREITWDAILGGFGPDVEFIQSALAYTFTHCTIDQQRMALAGFSDGASYALSLGIGNGDFFTHLMAFAPGVMTPAEVRGKPHLFITHGTNDSVMPIDDTSRRIVGKLKQLGYHVTYREFDGGHRVPPEIVREAFEWFKRN
jgi:phospholipase/carboxylesterase